jgi:RNA polymerase sigma-70 factor (ECF subfamily)
MLTAAPVVVHGAEAVAKGAMAAMQRARFTGPALIDGAVGLVMAPHRRLRVALTFTIIDGLITAIDVIAEPDRLDRLHLAVLD